jgi:hypothetical protein
MRRAVLFFMLMSSAALAQDAHYDAANDLSDEMLKCAGFYAVMARCFEGQADATMKRNTEQNRTNLITGATTLARQIGLLDATSLARTELHMKDFTKKIAGDCRNISILLNQIGGSCQSLASNPKPRFDELLAEKQKAYGPGKPR